MNPRTNHAAERCAVVARACQQANTSVTLAGSDMKEHGEDLHLLIAEAEQMHRVRVALYGEALVGNPALISADPVESIQERAISHRRLVDELNGANAEIRVLRAKLTDANEGIRSIAHDRDALLARTPVDLPPPVDTQIVDWLAARWDSQATTVQQIANGLWLDNPTGSFRDAVLHAMKQLRQSAPAADHRFSLTLEQLVYRLTAIAVELEDDGAERDLWEAGILRQAIELLKRSTQSPDITLLIEALRDFLAAAAVRNNVGGEVTIFGWNNSRLTDAYKKGRFAISTVGHPEFFDLVAHLHRQRAFSLRTFGPGERTAANLDHIRKELAEIEANPNDTVEWVDVVLLALDGAWRHGATPEHICRVLAAKQAKNEARTWPDWRTSPADKAICHVEPQK